MRRAKEIGEWGDEMRMGEWDMGNGGINRIVMIFFFFYLSPSRGDDVRRSNAAFCFE